MKLAATLAIAALVILGCSGLALHNPACLWDCESQVHAPPGPASAPASQPKGNK